jgi:hypothetical protein
MGSQGPTWKTMLGWRPASVVWNRSRLPADPSDPMEGGCSPSNAQHLCRKGARSHNAELTPPPQDDDAAPPWGGPP